jgi:nucleotide-binding universal stress UspA family protein
MSRSIVCGLDETAGSRHAAAIASRLARDLDSRAVLVQVLERPGFLQRFPPASIARSRRVRRSLRAVAEEHCFPDGTEALVRKGHPASVLVAVAEREDAELMVVAAGGRSTVSVGLLGHVTTALMRDAPCPIVAVPAETVAPMDAEGMRSVVCGVADDDTASATLRLADDLATRLGGELHAVHAYGQVAADTPTSEVDLRQAAEGRLGAFLDAAGCEANGTVVGLPPAQALELVADRHHAALIVVGFGGHSDEPSIVLGSIPTELAAKGRTAVVVVPSGTRLEPGSGHYELAAAAPV